MRRYHALLLCAACLIAGLALVSRNGVSAPEPGLSDSLLASPESGYRAVFDELRVHSVDLILDVEAYEDIDYGFRVAIPAGWRKIVTAESAEHAVSDLFPDIETKPARSDDVTSRIDLQTLEPGYAVGFESSQQHEGDQFADYILVEILPGDLSGLFAADANHRQSVVIDGRSAWFDRLEIKQASSGLTDVDLVIYQAELAGVGYTVGLYAIGEQTSERIMAIAFEVMLQTFKVDRPPFSVS